MKRNKKWYFGAGIMAAIVLAVLALTTGEKEVEMVQVRQGSITRAVIDTGYVQPSADYDIQAAQTARVAQVPVETGQPVNQGQTLVVLENLDLAVQISDVRSQLSQSETTAAGARAALERIQLEMKDAQENFDRMQQLFQAKVISRADYDKARLQVETARQNLSEQRSKLDSALTQGDGLQQSLQQLTGKERQLVVKSPVDGTVLNLPAQQEQVVSPGTLLATVAAQNSLEIKADILSDDLADVQTGQKVSVTAPVLGQQTLVGEVKKIYPRAEEKQSALGLIQRRVPVIIGLSDLANLKPGYEVKVAIETLQRDNVPVVPREAVRTTAGGQKELMVVVNNRVQRRTVQTGVSDQESIEITGGLTAGEQIIRDGSLDLAEKTKVKPVNKI